MSNHNTKVHVSNAHGVATDSVDWSQDVYLNIELAKPVNELVDATKDRSGKYQVSFSLQSDDGNFAPVQFFQPPAAIYRDTLTVDIAVAKENATTEYSYPAMNLMTFLRDIESDTPTISFEMSKDYETTATGEFQVDLSGLDKNALWLRAKEASEHAANNWTVALPENFDKANDQAIPDLSREQMVEICKKSFPQVEEILEIVTVGTPTWTVDKDELDVPVSRYTYKCRTMIAYRGKDGDNYFLDEVITSQKHEGGGKYGELEMYLRRDYYDRKGDKIKDGEI